LYFKKRYRRLFLRLHSRGNRKDTRRLRFSFFLLQCQSAGDLHPDFQCYSNPLEVDLRDRQDLSRFPLARLPAGFADRVLISHRGVGAFAPASLSDAVYRFHPIELSNKIRKVFHFFYKPLKNNVIMRCPQLLNDPNKVPRRNGEAEFHDNHMNSNMLQRKMGLRHRERDPIMVNDFEMKCCKNNCVQSIFDLAADALILGICPQIG
jgi:hypothetical protein